MVNRAALEQARQKLRQINTAISDVRNQYSQIRQKEAQGQINRKEANRQIRRLNLERERWLIRDRSKQLRVVGALQRGASPIEAQRTARRGERVEEAGRKAREFKREGRITPQRKPLTRKQVENRVKVLQNKGLSRSTASQIALAESRGQKVTNLSVASAREIQKAPIRTSAVRSEEVKRLSIFEPYTTRGKLTRAVIDGKVYTDVRPREVLNNELDSNTTARLLPQETALRSQIAQAQQRIRSGEGTTKDLNLIKKGRRSALESKEVSEIKSKIRTSEALEVRKNVLNNLRRTNIIKRRNQIINEARKRLGDDTKTLNVFSEVLVGNAIANAISKSPISQRNAFFQIVGGFGSAAGDYVKSLGRGALKLTSTTDKGDSKTFLDAPIFKKYWNTSLGKKHKEFINYSERLGGEISRISKTKGSRFSDKDVQNFLVLTGFLLLPQSRLISLGFKGVSGLGIGYTGAAATENIINKNYKNAGRALFDASLYALIFIGSGKKPRLVETVPKRTTAKVGEVFKTPAGDIGIVTKGGRVIRVPKNKQPRFLKAELRGLQARRSKTEIARLEKKSLRKPSELTRSEQSKLRIAREERAIKTENLNQKQFENKLLKNANDLARTFKIDKKDKPNFIKLYLKYQNNPSKANIRKFTSFVEDRIITRGVEKLDKIILRKPKKEELDISILDLKIENNLFRDRYGVSKTRVNQIISKAKKRARELNANSKELTKVEKLAFDFAVKKRGASKKLESFLSKLREKALGEGVKRALSKADRQARKKGFKDAKEFSLYKSNFEKYKKGDLNAEKVLSRIERDMSKRKSDLSKKKAKEFKQTRNRLVKEAIFGLSAGRFKIKEKGFVIKKAKNTLSKAKRDAIALQVNSILDSLEKKKLTKEKAIARVKGKVALREIVNGKVVEVKDPIVLREMKILLNKDKLAQIRKEKALRIKEGLIKGKEPKKGLGKSRRKELREKARLSDLKEYENLQKIYSDASKRKSRLISELKRSEKLFRLKRTPKKALSKAQRKIFRERAKKEKSQVKNNIENIKKLSLDLERSLKRSDKLIKLGRRSKTSLPKSQRKAFRERARKETLNLRKEIQKSLDLERSLKRSEKMEKLGRRSKTSLPKSQRKAFREIKDLDKEDGILIFSEKIVKPLVSNNKDLSYSVTSKGIFIKSKSGKNINLAKRLTKNSREKVGSKLAEFTLKGKSFKNISPFYRKLIKNSLRKRSQKKKIIQKGKAEILKSIKRDQDIANKILSGEDINNFKVNINIDGGISLKPLKSKKGKKINFARDILKKKKIPKDAVEVPKSDGTIQIIKTKKITEKIPSKQKSEIKSLQKKATQKTVQKLKKAQQKKVKTAKKRLSLAKAKLEKRLKIFNTLANESSLNQTQKRALKLSQSSDLILIDNLKRLVRLAILTDSVLSKDPLVKSIQKLILRTDDILIPKLKQVLKRKPIKPKIKAPPPPAIIPLFKLSWDKKPPRGQNYLVRIVVRIRGKNRVLPLKTTPNRARKFIESKIDNSTSRSYRLKIVGLTKKKDIKYKKSKKFRPKVSRGSKVLPVVEKTKYAIDTRGEKRGLKLSKLLKRGRKSAKKTKSSKVRKRRSKKRTTRKRKK